MSPAIRLAAVASGAIGLVADILLVLFYVTAQPWSDSPEEGWYGHANDVLMIFQYLALIPVVLALGRLAGERLWTRIALGASTAVVVLQLSLVMGVLSFDIQVVPVALCSTASMLWAGMISRSLTGAARTLGRTILIGLPVALVAFLLGTAVSALASVDWAWAAGGIPGGILWFLLPLWTLVVGAAPSLTTATADGRTDGELVL